jgi:hypothetical protein
MAKETKMKKEAVMLVIFLFSCATAWTAGTNDLAAFGQEKHLALVKTANLDTNFVQSDASCVLASYNASGKPPASKQIAESKTHHQRGKPTMASVKYETGAPIRKMAIMVITIGWYRTTSVAMTQISKPNDNSKKPAPRKR